MLRRIRAYIAHEQGQTMAEYAVVLSVITVATLAAFTALSGGYPGSDHERHRSAVGEEAARSAGVRFAGRRPRTETSRVAVRPLRSTRMESDAMSRPANAGSRYSPSQ